MNAAIPKVAGKVPPNDLEAERAVLSASLLDDHARSVALARLTSGDWYSPQHAAIWRAIEALAHEGAVIDLVSVHAWLRLHGANQHAGGAAYLAEIADATPAVQNVASHCEIVRALAVQRQGLALLQAAIADGYQPGSPAAWLSQLQRSVAGLRGETREDSGAITGAELWTELPPVPWLVRDLGIAPGAPTMFAGYGYSGKTLASQALAMSVASGREAWDVYAVRRGVALHVDYEQGRRLTLERYQRLARWLHVGPEDVEDRLRVLPPDRAHRLDQSDSEAWVDRVTDGVSLAVWDSFRASSPSVDENDSSARGPLDLLMRSSERTGCVHVVIHHARKPSDNREGGAKMSIRGSSGIYDACASVFVFAGEKGEPSRIKQEKDRHRGHLIEDVELHVEDHPDGALSIRAASPMPETVSAAVELGATETRILGVLGDRPGGASLRTLRALVRGGRGMFEAALETLTQAGKVAEQSGPNRSRIFTLGATA